MRFVLLIVVGVGLLALAGSGGVGLEVATADVVGVEGPAAEEKVEDVFRLVVKVELMRGGWDFLWDPWTGRDPRMISLLRSFKKF